MDFSIRGTQVFRTAAPGAATDHFRLAPWRWGPHGTLAVRACHHTLAGSALL